MSKMGSDPRRLTGRCYCGAVEYRVADEFEYAMNCHCSECRRTTGSAFKPMAGIPTEKLSLVKGQGATLQYGDETTHNLHCRVCGSLLYSRVREGRYVHVAMGTLVDCPTIRPQRHIFVGSKAPWFEITDDLPQFEGFPTS
jgi:hypothetical protein